MKPKKRTPKTWTMWAITWSDWHQQTAPDVHKCGAWMICCLEQMANQHLIHGSGQKIQRVRVQFVKPKRKHEDHP